jgi:putative transposase
VRKEQEVKRNLSHTVWECKYHIVWIPKKRRKIVYGKLRKKLGTILRRLCEYKGVEVVEGTLCADHIHMCLAIPAKYSVSTRVGYIKGKSAMRLFEKYSRLKKNFRGHRFWARGYSVSTASGSSFSVDACLEGTATPVKSWTFSKTTPPPDANPSPSAD